MLANSSIRTPPVTSSPLRRKSVIPQNRIASALLENDDEAERLALRHEITSTPANSKTSNNRRRSSLGIGLLMHMPVSQMNERISQCVKLSTENKINTKNAFSLQMIDFMVYMVKKKDANMTDLQVASTSLDVSTKIYGFRVDGIHMDILKMISGQDKQQKGIKDLESVEEMDYQIETKDNKSISRKEKRKNKNKQCIFTTAEALKMTVANEKPSLMTMEADLQTTDMLYQAILPNHANSKFYLHPYNDILVDSVNNKGTQNRDTVYNIPRVEDFSEGEICPPLFFFDFHSWNADDEESNETQSEQNNESNFQFDPDVSLSHKDEHIFTTMNQITTEETQEENVDKCAAIPNQGENIVNFCEILSSTVPQVVSEYSFVQQNLHIDGTGPSHWNCSSLKKSSFDNNTENKKCCNAERKKRKEIELRYDNDATRNVDKFLQSEKVKIHTRTVRTEWNEELLILPPNMRYDITQANKLYSHRITLKQPQMNRNTSSTSCLSDNMQNYSHANESDTSNHSFNAMNEEYQKNDNNIANDCVTRFDTLGSQMPFTGTNLVSVPKLTNKLVIEYSVRAKKIDMKQLKQSIWKCITSKQSNLNEATLEKSIHQSDKVDDCKCFSNVYRQLPSMLTRINIEALSFPISFISLLHLANEKTLKVSPSLDMADLIIEQA
ncbi:condensin complex subunit 2 [Xylocopa sonorina]|uniref:condensin complex subunit 2 n=1 Tax=Xylocopa sonorina TaxID=1818115 RepID=UPI00403B06DD